MDEIPAVTIADLLDRSADIDTWVTPIDPSLKMGLRWAAGGILAGAPVGFLCTPLLISWAYSGFFMFLGPVAVFLLSVLCSPVGIIVNMIAAALLAHLYQRSHGFQSETVAWHKVGVGLVVVGAVNIAVVTLPLAIVVLNALAWVVLIVLALAIACAVLFGAAAAR